MNKITKFMIFVFLTIFIIGCTTHASQPVEQKIVVDESLQERYNDLFQENNEMLEKINKLEQEKLDWDESWRTYLWHTDSYDYAPSKCKNPYNQFTMCKEGCKYEYYCDSSSMNPFFDCNAKLTLVECSEYKIGDIILFNNKDKELNDYDFLIHSIVGKEWNTFITKGYNNNGIDSFKVYKSDIKGKVTKIEY